VVAYAFTVVMLGGTIPTPLYPIYQHRIGFSALVVTLVFAAYAAGTLAALLVFGRLSDQVGRRPVILAALGVAVTSTAVFVLDQSLTGLFVGRALSGLSVGLCTGAATAGLAELHPSSDRVGGALVASTVQMAGLGLGQPGRDGGEDVGQCGLDVAVLPGIRGELVLAESALLPTPVERVGQEAPAADGLTDQASQVEGGHGETLHDGVAHGDAVSDIFALDAYAPKR